MIRAHVFVQRLGEEDGAIGLAVGFHNRDHEAGNGEPGSVEDVGELGRGAGFGAEPDVSAAGLIGFEVGAGADFEIAALAGGPDFEVVALASFVAHISGAKEKNSVMEAEGLEDGFGIGGEGFEVVVAFFGSDEFDEFDFVELVHAENSASVATGGSGFASEAGGVGGVLDRHLPWF